MESSSSRDEEASSLLTELSLREKLSLLTGNSLWEAGVDFPRLGLRRSFRLSDGPHGVRKPQARQGESFPATCFPAGCALACSWSTDALEAVGRALSLECELHDVQVLLGPAINLKRHPGGGRNFEYFSEDPLLTGRLAAAYVRGVQESGQVSACCKHFAANNQEAHRMVVDAMVDPRTLRELYLRGFEIALQASPDFVMGAYNKVNGTYCCNHRQLLHRILRDEWKFQGICVTDWGATSDRIESVIAGMDLEMPGTGALHHSAMEMAVREGRLTMKDIDVCAKRILKFLLRRQQSSAATAVTTKLDASSIFEKHHLLAHEIAMECAVMLKNDNQILPLERNVSIALVGDFAKDFPRYQGMGSSHVSAPKISNAYDAMLQFTHTVSFARGYDADQDDDVTCEVMIEEAVIAAKRAEVVVMFLGLPEILESEGYDRFDLKFPKQQIVLLQKICQLHSNVIVVLSNGGMVELPPEILQVQAILEGYLLGQAGGSAVVDLLFGRASPCGRLAETMPITLEDVPANNYFPGTRDAVEYREGLDIGYRYFDTAMRPIHFPFGHGLTYTTFSYTQPTTEVLEDNENTKHVKVTFRLCNEGSVEAKEVAQCYIRPLDCFVYRPQHELKAFAKVLLEPGQVKMVTFDLKEWEFSYWDIGLEEWIVQAGSSFEIQIGASSRDIRLTNTISFAKGRSNSSLAQGSYPPRRMSDGMTTPTKVVDDETFASRFGMDKELVLEKIQLRRDQDKMQSTIINQNSLMKEVRLASNFGALIYWIAFQIAIKEIKAGQSSYRREIRMV